MIPEKSPLPGETEGNVSALIETLHEAGQRLEELTAGEVDTVTDRRGRTVLLRRAQDHMRQNEAAKQAAILDALPAHIALLDTQGVVLSVNEAWRRFADANAIQAPGYGVGLNYLDICDHAQGNDAAVAHQVAAGIRSVLAGAEKRFSIEYPCHSPMEQRWFLMTATPLAGDPPNGAVVMHLDITERKNTETDLRWKTAFFESLVKTSADGVLVVDEKGQKILQNQRTRDLWKIPEAIAEDPDDSRQMRFVMNQIVDAKQFGDKVLYLYSHPQETSQDEVALKDGTILDRYSAPVLDGDGHSYGRIWSFRDITGRKRLEQEKEQYFKFFMLSTNPMCIADPFGCFKQVNPAFVELLGYSERELVSKPFLDFVLPQDRQMTANEMKLQVETRASRQFENRFLRRDGTVIHLLWMAFFDRREGVTYATASDITGHKKAQDRIAHLNRVYAMLSGINTLIVRVRDRNAIFTEACRIAVEEGGFRMALMASVDRSGMTASLVASAGFDEEFMVALKDHFSLVGSAAFGSPILARAINEKKAVVVSDLQANPEVVFRRNYTESGVRSMAVLPVIVAEEVTDVLVLYASESEFFQDEELKLLTDLAGDIAFAMDHIDKQERLDYLAYYDVLTGLANRPLFLDRVAQYMRSAVSGGHKLAVYLIDLERFKNVNDSLGRPAGDALLRLVAQWLTRNAGDANLLARVDADHFAVVLPEVKQAGDVARALEQSIEAFLLHPFHLNDAVFRIAAKVGVALFPDDGTDADTLFKHAEAALKKAKASGERYLFYTQKMTEAVADKLALENQLRQALDHGEFVLHYQPKVNLVSGRMTSAEALIRWNDPRTGLVPPGRFIPTLEETGLIHEVGRWALRQAISDYLRWHAAGLPAVRIAVNVSPLQLRDPGFVAEIRQKISIDPHAAAGLELEITESLMMDNVEHNIASLKAIRAMGVSIAIDDFGTGFSSLSYLSRFPVDTLKIDRSFVTDMTASPQGLALVSTVIDLAHSLKLKVVAEGVETDEQSRLLRLLNCDEMQGFLFSKAVPADVFETSFLIPFHAR